MEKGDEVRYEGRWLRCGVKRFRDAHGREKEWEFASRVGTGGAVCMVATIPGSPPRLVLIRQFRPPVEAPVIEFPAGLVEPGEDVAETALRELAEETGCKGEITALGPFVYSSPGLTDERVAIAEVTVTARGETRPEADEDIEVLEAPGSGSGLRAFLQEQADAGCAIDAKLWAFALGRSGSQ